MDADSRKGQKEDWNSSKLKTSKSVDFKDKKYPIFYWVKSNAVVYKSIVERELTRKKKRH